MKEEPIKENLPPSGEPCPSASARERAPIRESTPLAELWPVIREVFDKGGTFTLCPRGTSMLPLLRPGEDSVTLAPPPEEIKRYDVLLYRRPNGAFVLHRVYRVEGETLTMIGDNQVNLERGVSKDAVLAIATGRTREGVYLPFSAPALVRYASRRMQWLPLRAFFVKGWNKLCRILKIRRKRPS